MPSAGDSPSVETPIAPLTLKVLPIWVGCSAWTSEGSLDVALRSTSCAQDVIFRPSCRPAPSPSCGGQSMSAAGALRPRTICPEVHIS